MAAVLFFLASIDIISDLWTFDTVCEPPTEGRIGHHADRAPPSEYSSMNCVAYCLIVVHRAQKIEKGLL